MQEHKSPWSALPLGSPALVWSHSCRHRAEASLGKSDSCTPYPRMLLGVQCCIHTGFILPFLACSPSHSLSTSIPLLHPSLGPGGALPSPSQNYPLDPLTPICSGSPTITNICRAPSSGKNTSDSTAWLRDLLGMLQPAPVLLSNPYLLLSTTNPYQWPPQWQLHSHGLSRIQLSVSSEGVQLWKTK